MAYKKLLSLVPGFKTDRDEDWMTFLSDENKAFLRNERANCIQCKAGFDQVRDSFKDEMKNKNLDKKQKLRETSKHNEFVKELEELREEQARMLIPRVEELREEGLRKNARIMSFENKNPKRVRTEDNFVRLRSGEEVEIDDYMPKAAPSRTASTSRHARPVAPDDKPEKPFEFKPRIDTFLLGVKPKDAEILNQLRTLIIQYNCRKKVLKALDALREKDKKLKALDLFTSSLNRVKKDIAEGKLSVDNV